MSETAAKIWELLEANGIEPAGHLFESVTDAVDAGAPFLVVDLDGSVVHWVANAESIPSAVDDLGGLAIVVVV